MRRSNSVNNEKRYSLWPVFAKAAPGARVAHRAGARTALRATALRVVQKSA
ncbi:MbtH family NRPS accessory protein [Mycobacterium sp. NPDC051804]|uniref:MbtH family NRPS accessory protein n=1 Tax=Mycobacterium sp. NPDC051804 TaxID=3364295 RepID=UPI0037B7300C